jgi:hypothetical protein
MNTLVNLMQPWLLIAAAPAWAGKAAFIGAFLALVVVLVLLPPRLAGESAGRPPWWRNVRFWAILIALTQIALYAWWG